MSTLAPPVPSAASDPIPRVSADTGSRRTLLGFVGTRRVVEVILTVVLGVGGGLLLFGAQFGLDMVHSQLNAQAISFPAKGSPGLSPTEFPDLQRYAGRACYELGDYYEPIRLAVISALRGHRPGNLVNNVAPPWSLRS